MFGCYGDVMHIKEDIFYEQDGGEYYKVILPRTNKKPMSFYGTMIYENKHQQHGYMCIYKTSERVITSRYVVYHIYGFGGYEKTYMAKAFDDGFDAFTFIGEDKLELTLTANDFLEISYALDCCETEELI